MTKLLNQVNKLLEKSSDGTAWPAYNSIGGEIKLESRADVRFVKGTDSSNPTRIELREKTGFFLDGRNTIAFVKVTDIRTIADQLDDAYMTTGDYRRVMDDSKWKKLFQVKKRTMNYVHGTTAQTKEIQTLPCYKCGIVLPRGHITIDHVKPQAGGAGQATLKVLRNMNHGLTNAQGKGHVAQAYVNRDFSALPTKAGRDDVLEDEDEAGKSNRYTLSHKGMVFASIAVAASSVERLGDMCMHAVYNLKPFCAKCNIKKSDELTDLSWIDS